jgi:diguanylate cyclase (GGDEF)-like protein
MKDPALRSPSRSGYVPSAYSPERAQHVRAEQVRMFFSQPYSVPLAFALGLVALGYLLHDSVPLVRFASWGTTVGLGILAWATAVRWYRRLPARAVRGRAWYLLSVVLSTAMGFGWGSVIWLVVPAGDVVLRLLGVIVVGSVSLCALPVVVAVLPAFLGFFGLAVGLTVWALISAGSVLQSCVGVLLSLFGAAITANAVLLHHSVVGAFAQRYLAEDLTRRLAVTNRYLDHLASRDPLTDLLNRRGMQHKLEAEVGRSERHGRVCSLVLFDLDRFKGVNDRFGHQAGDKVLQTVAEMAASGVRREDTLSRWGGEEFLCLLPETGCADALTAAERLRQSLQGLDVPVGGGRVSVTASFGVVSFPHDGTDVDRLLAAVDAALYRAKEAGRNRVCAPAAA